MRKTILRITAIILILASILTCGAALLPGDARNAASEEPDGAEEPGPAEVPAPHSESAGARKEKSAGDDVQTAAPPDEPAAAIPSSVNGSGLAGSAQPHGDNVPSDGTPASDSGTGGGAAPAASPAGSAEESAAVPSEPDGTPAAAHEDEDPVPPSHDSDAPAAAGSTAAEESRYASLALSDTDLELLARLIYLEARGEPYEGQVAVAEVVLNRVLSDRFPDTVEEVLYQTGQFTPAPYLESTTPGEEQYKAAADAADGLECVTGADVVFFSGAPYNDRIFAVIGNHYFCEL